MAAVEHARAHRARLVPVLALAEQVGLSELVAEYLTIRAEAKSAMKSK